MKRAWIFLLFLKNIWVRTKSEHNDQVGGSCRTISHDLYPCTRLELLKQLRVGKKLWPKKPGAQPTSFVCVSSSQEKKQKQKRWNGKHIWGNCNRSLGRDPELHRPTHASGGTLSTAKQFSTNMHVICTSGTLDGGGSHKGTYHEARALGSTPNWHQNGTWCPILTHQGLVLSTRLEFLKHLRVALKLWT